MDYRCGADIQPLPPIRIPNPEFAIYFYTRDTFLLLLKKALPVVKIENVEVRLYILSDGKIHENNEVIICINSRDGRPLTPLFGLHLNPNKAQLTLDKQIRAFVMTECQLGIHHAAAKLTCNGIFARKP